MAGSGGGPFRCPLTKPPNCTFVRAPVVFLREPPRASAGGSRLKRIFGARRKSADRLPRRAHKRGLFRYSGRCCLGSVLARRARGRCQGPRGSASEPLGGALPVLFFFVSPAAR